MRGQQLKSHRHEPRSPRCGASTVVWCTVLALITAALVAGPAWSFQIYPNKTRNDSKLANLAGLIARLAHSASDRFLGAFKSRLHEAATAGALGCERDDPVECAADEAELPAVVWGVRWNDDPPFRMVRGGANCRYEQTIRAGTQPKCWYELFTDGEKRAAAGEVFGPGYALLYRSHFGDLQFLHAMASRDGEAPETTRRNILMWAEYTWGLAIGSLSPTQYIRNLGVPGLAALFRGELSSTALFALGVPEFQRTERIAEVAFGSLLHVVQDSFSRAHVTRDEATGAMCEGIDYFQAPGAIRQFHSYGRQNHKTHDLADEADALRRHMLEESPTVFSVGRALNALRRRGSTWPEAAVYINCLFALSPAAQPAGPGEGFER